MIGEQLRLAENNSDEPTGKKFAPIYGAGIGMVTGLDQKYPSADFLIAGFLHW